MSFNVNDLSEYVDQMRKPLIAKALLSAKSTKLLTVQADVKHKAALNLLTGETVFGDDNCEWEPTGTTKLSQRELEVGKIKINKNFCKKDLQDKWLGHEVKVAINDQTIPFVEEFINLHIEGIATNLEKAIWQGDKTSMDPNLNKFDGLIKIIDDATGVIEATNTGITSITEANVITIVDNVFRAIPETLIDKDNVVIVCGNDTFRKYVLALRSANLFHYSYEMDKNMELTIPGTNIKLVALNGLNGTNRLFAFQTSNVFYGVDNVNDNEVFEFFYDAGARKHKLDVSFVAGVQIAFPDEIVEFTLA